MHGASSGQPDTHLTELLELLHTAAPKLHAAGSSPPEVGTFLWFQLGLFLRPLLLRQTVRDLRGHGPKERSKINCKAFRYPVVNYVG